MSTIKVLSLFSGAGGLDLGLERAGMEVVALCEIDPKARAVLRKHWPATRIYEDVREVSRERLKSDGIVRPHFVAGGSPCQDLSVAGKRRGLDGSRSGLFWEQCRIADELEADILWENVPGALSSNNGADFAAVLWGITGALVELPHGQKWPKGGVLVGPKRTAVWRVADAQRFGVPQRRRRVYVVGCSGAVARRLAPLLLEFAGGEGNRAAGREAGTRAARTVADSSDDASGPRAGRSDGELFGDDRLNVGAAYSTGHGWWNDAEGAAGTLRGEGHPHEANLVVANVRNGTVSSEVTGTLMAHQHGWSPNDIPMVLQEPLAWVKAKRASSTTDDDTWRSEPVSPTLNIFDNGSDARSTVLMVQPVGFRPAGFATYDEGVGTLRARDAKGNANMVVQTPVVADVVYQLGQSPTGSTDVASTLGGPGSRGGHRQDLDTCGAYIVVSTPPKPEFVETTAFQPAAQGNHLVAQVAQSPTGSTEVSATIGAGGRGQRFDLDSCGAYVVVSEAPEKDFVATYAFQPADQVLGKGALKAVETDVAPTIAIGDHHSDRGLRVLQAVAPVAFSAGNSEKAYGIALSENLTPPLRAGASGTNQVPTVMYQDSQYGVGEYDTAGTLRAGRMPEHQMIVHDDVVSATGTVAHALTAASSKGTTEDGTGRGVPIVAQNPDGLTVFTQNQRGEVRDLNGVAGALLADTGMQGQNFVTHPVNDE